MVLVHSQVGILHKTVLHTEETLSMPYKFAKHLCSGTLDRHGKILPCVRMKYQFWVSCQNFEVRNFQSLFIQIERVLSLSLALWKKVSLTLSLLGIVN